MGAQFCAPSASRTGIKALSLKGSGSDLLSDLSVKALNSTEDAHIKDMSTFETDEHLHAEHRYTAVGGVVGVLTFVTRQG